jgi:arylsulfatase A-like enzyme
VRTSANAFVTDVTPTLLDMAGTTIGSNEAKPMTGRSLLPLLSGKTPSVYAPSEGFGIEVSGNAAYFQGDFKLVRIEPPFGDASWKLYNIAQDPGETTDLALVNPPLFAQMQAAYQDYAKANGVLDLPDGYQVQKQATQNAWKRQLALNGPQLAIFVLIIMALGGWLVSRRSKKPKKVLGEAN